MEDNNGQFLIDEFASESEKTKESYAIALMNRFWTRWGGWSYFNSRYLNYQKLRALAEGRQNVQEIIDQTTTRQEGGEPNSSWTNLDYSPPAILPIIIDGAVGDLMSHKHKVSCKAADADSNSKKLEAKNRELNLLKFKPLLEEVEQTTGIPTPKPKFDTEAEIEVEHENFKLSLEEAIEVSVQNIYEQNNIESIERRMWYDLINIKMSVVRCYYDINWKTRFEYIDPALYLCTTSLEEDFRDVNCEGHLQMITISELKRKSGYDNEKLYEIASKFAGKIGNAQTMVGYIAGLPDVQYTWFSNLVMVFHYRFISIDTSNYKEVKTFAGKTRIYKGEGRNPEETLSKDIENLYEGTWVVGSDCVYGHRKCKNMIRPRLEDAVSTKVLTGYFKFAPNMRNGVNVSHTERAMMFSKQWHLAFLKLQQFIAKAKVPGYRINISGMNAVDLGSGKTDFDPLAMLVFDEQTGSLVYSSDGEGGVDKNLRPPVEWVAKTIGETEKLINACNFYLGCIRQVFGRPEGVDASNPNPDALVGIQNAVAGAAQRSLEPLRQGFTNIMKGASNYLCMMIQDKATDMEGMAIGDLNVDILKLGKDLENATLGIDIEYEPDDKEMFDMKTTLDFEVKNGGLKSEDALYIKGLRNVKQMQRIMKVKRAQKIKEEQDKVAFATKQQTISNTESGTATAKAQMDAELAIINSKKELAILESKLKEKQMWTQAAANAWEMSEEAKITSGGEYDKHIYTLAEQAHMAALKPTQTNAT